MVLGGVHSGQGERDRLRLVPSGIDSEAGGLHTPVLGIIAPHPPIIIEEVGGKESRLISASIAAMRKAASVLDQYGADSLIVMSPHSPSLVDAFAIDTSPHMSGSLARFGADSVRIDAATDVEFAQTLLDGLDTADIPALSRDAHVNLQSGVLDHGVIVPLAFLDPHSRLPLVSLSQSGLSMPLHHALGEQIAAAAHGLGRRIAFVASGDLSHRLSPGAPAGYSTRGKEFDEAVVDLVRSGDLDELARLDPDLTQDAGECGLRSFVTLSGAIPDPQTLVVAYEGPWGVGYLTALVSDAPTFSQLELSDTETPDIGRKGGEAGRDRHPVVALAREAIETHVRQGKAIEPDPIEDPSLPDKAGVFVSLHRGGSLRGCIGTIEPACDTLAEEVVRSAIQAATADPRFSSVTSDELADLVVKVDVLHPPEECSIDDLEPSTHGVIVTCGWKRGLLLPDIEGVDTTDQQLDIARRKAGIDDHESCDLERFRVDRYI